MKAGGKAAQVVEDLGVATVAAIPQAAVAMMTGGAGAAEKGIEVARRAPGVFSTLRAAVSATAKNPMFWSSYFQTVGNEYETAKEDGAGEAAATLYALSIGAMNAAVEVGGGIETLPTELQGSRFTVKKWIESMVDEGKEEVVQGIISRAGQNLFYGKNNPLVSVADQDAVLNPVTAAQEFAGGAVVGGILGGAQGVAANILNGVADSKVQSVKSDSAVQKAVDKAQTARYDKNIETAGATVLNRGATLYAQLGMNVKKAEAKAAVVQKLIAGKDVTTGELKSLNLSDAKYQAIFTELTGVVFPEGVKMSDDQRFNLARTAKDVAKARAQAEKLVAAVLEDTGENSSTVGTADTTQPENATQGVQEAAEAAELRDPDNGPADYDYFAQAYRGTVKEDASDSEIRASYEGYLRDSETITTQHGTVTRAEFRTMMRQSGQDSGMTDEQLNAFFDYVRENENRGGAPMFNTSEEDAQNGGADEAKQAYPGRELSEDERRTPFAAEAGERGQTVRVFEGAAGTKGEGRSRLGRFSAVENPSETAAQTVAELEALGVPAFVHAGDLEILSSNGTVLRAEEDAATVNKASVGVADSIDIPPKETAGHEAYHFKDGLTARVEYDDVVSANMDVSSDAFAELYEHIEKYYFDGDYDSGNRDQLDRFDEELRAYVSGYIHNNSVPDGLLIDEAEVRTAWEKLIESGKGVSKDGGVQVRRDGRSLEANDPGAARTGSAADRQNGERTQSPGERRGRSNVRDAGERVQRASEAEGRVQGEGRELNRVPEGAAEADGPAEAPSSIAQRFHSWEGAYLYMEDQGLNLTFDVPPNQARLFGEISVGYQDGGKWVDLGTYDLGAAGLAQFKSDFGNLLAKSDPGFTAANQVSTVKKMIAGMGYDVLADPGKMGFEKAVKDAQRVGMTLDVVNDKRSFRKSDGSYVAGVASPEGYILTTRDVKSADHEVMHGYPSLFLHSWVRPNGPPRTSA